MQGCRKKLQCRSSVPRGGALAKSIRKKPLAKTGRPAVKSSAKMQNEELRRAQEELAESQRKYADLFNFAPLVSMASFARILGEDYPDCLGEKGIQYVDIITNSAKRMERLLSDILEFSKISTKELSMDTLDLNVIAASAWQEAASSAGQRSVKVDIGPLPAALGDPAMIRRVFVNLFSNALKFTAPRDAAAVEVRGQKGREESFYSLSDNGVGFDMKYAGRLFGIFQRLHDPKEFAGTGAGLSIVKRIIEKHGGRVWAEGKPGEGATFYFTLPAV
jgi:light-regulated signal transduction histidine kinase (bacteriophytochrome)